MSEFTKSEFFRLVGIPRHIFATTHLGVAPDWFAEKSESRPHPNRYILYVGNVKPNKNVLGLLKAFLKISGDIPHDMVIVGKKDGFISEDRAVFEFTKKLAGRVTFTGHVSDQLLKQYYAFADILALPSFYEGFGLPPLEAMASGCPVLVSDAASLPEVCGDGAIYINPYDIDDIKNKLLMILTNEQLREELKIKGSLRCKKFSWDDTAAKTVSVIQKNIAR